MAGTPSTEDLYDRLAEMIDQLAHADDLIERQQATIEAQRAHILDLQELLHAAT